MKAKKVLSAMLAGAMCVSLLAGCGNKETSEKEGNADTLTYWYWADTPEYSEKMQEIVANFNETNESGVTVVAEEQPWDGGAYSENMFTAAMGGGGPDIATFKLTSTPLYVNNDLLEDLTPYVDAWDMKDDIDENLYNIMKEAGGDDEAMYVMPWNTQVLYVYYRPSYFQQAGIEVPTTYEEFLEACEKCTMDTNGDGEIDVYGFGMRGSTGGQEPWGSFIYGRGGSFEDLTSEESIAGMQDYIDLYENGYVPPTAMSDGFDEIIANFKAGRTAMTIHHTGSSAGMVETFGDDVSAFAFPAGDGQWTSMGDTENVMFSSCANKDAAFEFLTYMATGDGEMEWCKATNNVPVSKTVQADAYFQDDRFMQASIAGQSYAGIIPILDTTSEWISTTWPNTIAQALSGDIDAKEAMETLNSALYEK